MIVKKGHVVRIANWARVERQFANRRAGLFLQLLVFLLAAGVALSAQTLQLLSKEYVYLNDRVVAVENPTEVTGAFTPGTPITVTTTVPGQNAALTFSGTAGQTVSVTLTNSTYAGCYGLIASIVKPDGTTLASTGLCNSVSGSIGKQTMPVAGTYTVLIDPQGATVGGVTVALAIL